MARETENDAISALQRTAVFSSLDETDLRRLLADCPRCKLRAAETILRAGQVADRFFVILAGRVKVFKLSAKGDEQILHFYGSGETFGEAAMFSAAYFPAGAQAVEDTMLLVVRRDVVLKLIDGNSEIALGMMAGLSAKLRQFAGLIEDLSLKEVPARLAGVLLGESQDGKLRSFRLAQNRRQLAASIGTVAETLSRAFKKLKDAGIIDVRGTEVTIRDFDALGRMCRDD